MPKKLAIVIAGAVSLGSYESGVMYEVIEAIARHNESLESDSEERIEIDVITGASAGGMTACMLAQHLICSDRSLRDPYENPLYKAWVKEVDIRDLLKVDVDYQKYSLLQPQVVEEIGAKYLKDQPQISLNRHIAAASDIKIGIAMSNLTGYSYEIPIQRTGEKEQFGYTRYKDQFVCSVTRSEDGEVTLKERTLIQGEDKNYWQDFRLTNWKELRDAGISSGAFPFAFPAKKITRFGKIEDNPELDEKNKFSDRDGEFWYTDGGVFENEPIAMARELVEQIDRDSSPTDKRYYLYVAPGARPLPKSPVLDIKGNDFIVIANALAGSIFQQARFSESVMRRIHNPIFSITAKDFQLLGDVFSAFAGFLEEKFRAYDYNIGRELARKDLEEATAQGLLKYKGENMPPIDWKVKCTIGGQTVNSWDEAKQKLSQLAKPLYKGSQEGQRDTVAELRQLMKEVDVKTNREILNQLLSRLDSLVAIFDNYVKVENIFFNGLKSISLPAAKQLLRWGATKWLKRNVLNLP